MTSDLLKDWIDSYQTQNFPEVLDKPNRRPFKCFIFDEPKKGFTLFKDYGWNPIKLELKVGVAEIKKKSTKKVTLVEPFPWEDMETTLANNANKVITSSIKKSKLAGHDLALSMMKSSSEISTEFKGFESDGFFMTEPKGDPTLDEDEKEVWTSTKTLGDLLEGKPLPTKKEAGVKHEVVGNLTNIKARVYYKAVFTGEVSSDHKEPFDGRRYWNFPLKYLLEYNDVPKQAVIYEEIQFEFYTGICVADVEPGSLSLVVEYEQKTYELQVKPSHTTDMIQDMVEEATGIVVSRQALKFLDGNKLPKDGSNVLDMGLQNGTKLALEIFKIPIKITCPNDQILELMVEPCDTIGDIKQRIQADTSIEVDNQLLTFSEQLLKDNGATVDKYGMQANSMLYLEEDFDPIIFIDIKAETLFARDRSEVLAKEVLTPIEDSKTEFQEAIKLEHEIILTNMFDCPRLGVNPNKIAAKTRISEHGVQEAQAVKDKWGVALKKVERNKKGEEFYFVDPKTGAVGELLRVKHIQNGFITPVDDLDSCMPTLKEAEQDTVKYDKYVALVRKAFGVGMKKKKGVYE